ncbi:MAG: iron-containing alcohol dehydrogenase [Bacteroidaceae bacterium]|nr:iron-containing alcohol dehydrogenase [Bacteroidaceae bacterium]MBR1790046.1 iron-containing alcohol dehydrogenase [Bacteroidaceae bacterium]
MEGNFSYHNPTKLYFGDDALKYLSEELPKYGPTVMLCYGGGSIKRNGIYDQVTQALKQAGKTLVEDGGVMPNPTVEKLYEGARMAREHNVDLILAVGGGSTIDYAKGVSVSAWCDGDPWQKYYVEQQEATGRVIPVGAVLTMVGTGSEMNGGSVITNRAVGMKIGKVFGPYAYPKFTLLNPRFTFTVPQYQMVAGFFDIMSHIMEQYFSGTDDNTSDYLAEGLMRSLIHSSRIAVRNPQDYEARSNIMWTATWALNTLLKCAKRQDWMVHMIGQAIGAHTDATHGMTLAAVSIPYYRFVSQFGVQKFARFARNVWGIRPEGKSEPQLAEEGIEALEAWMREIGVVMHAAELGVTAENIEAIADSTLIFDAGYHRLTRDEVVKILKESL